MAKPLKNKHSVKYSRADMEFFNSLFPEEGSEICRHEDCRRRTIKNSVMCAKHHFEMIKQKPCPWEERLPSPKRSFRNILSKAFLVTGILLFIFIIASVILSLSVSPDAFKLFLLSFGALLVACALFYVGSKIEEVAESPIGAVTMAFFMAGGFGCFVFGLICIVVAIRRLISGLI